MYRIGELAQLANISNDTLRYYEKHGLLTPANRSDSGYRLYNNDSVEQIKFIQRAKYVGFSLREIQELLSLKVDKAEHSCEEIKELTKIKLEDVQAKLVELQKIATALEKLHDACCGGSESAENCSILDALETGKGMEIKS